MKYGPWGILSILCYLIYIQQKNSHKERKEIVENYTRQIMELGKAKNGLTGKVIEVVQNNTAVITKVGDGILVNKEKLDCIQDKVDAIRLDLAGKQNQ